MGAGVFAENAALIPERLELVWCAYVLFALVLRRVTYPVASPRGASSP